MSRRTLLQSSVKSISNHLCLSSQPSVRISQHFDSESNQEFLPLFVTCLFVWQPVAETIKFDSKTSLLTEEVDIVRTD